TVLTEGAAAFKLAAFDDAGIETQIADEFLAGGKALDVADDGDQRIGGDQVEAGEFVETQEVRLFLDLQGHQATQTLPAFTGGDQAAVHLPQKELLSGTPLFEGKQSIQRFGPAETKALGQTQSVFVQKAAQVLLSPGAVF